MGDVSSSNLGKLIIGVIGLIRQADSALANMDNVGLDIFRITTDISIEEATSSAILQIGHEGDELWE